MVEAELRVYNVCGDATGNLLAFSLLLYFTLRYSAVLADISQPSYPPLHTLDRLTPAAPTTLALIPTLCLSESDQLLTAQD